MRQTLFVAISFAGVTAMISGEEVTDVEVVGGGRGVEKLNVGKDDAAMGREMAGSFGSSVTLSHENEAFTQLHYFFYYYYYLAHII